MVHKVNVHNVIVEQLFLKR